MQKTPWASIIIIGILAVILLILVGPMNTLNHTFSNPDRPLLEHLTPQQLQEISNMLALYVKGRTVLALINTGLLLYLMALYFSIYRENRSNFSLCLVLFSFTLFLYSITSNPILIWVNGFQETNIFNIFNFLPDIFTTLASAILIYLSRQ
jgi:amino acid transporter